MKLPFFSTHEDRERTKFMQFVKECADGSQVVTDFDQFEITAQKLSSKISGMDKHIFNGHFQKCRENYEKQNPSRLKQIVGLAIAYPIAHKAAEETMNIIADIYDAFGGNSAWNRSRPTK